MLYRPADPFGFFAKLDLNIEGPDSDNSTTDPDGGLTRFGISQKQNPDIDVANLTVQDALAFYRARHWTPNNCDDLPWPLDVCVAAASANQGPKTARMLLQAALNVTQDGVIGPQTLAAVNVRAPLELTYRFMAKCAVAYTKDSEWASDGEGWMYRLFTVLGSCINNPA